MTRLAAALCLLVFVAGCPRRPEPPSPDRGPASRPAPTTTALSVSDISFAGPAGPRRDATFMPGEVVRAFISVSGFTYEEGKADLRADLKVIGPAGQLVLDQPDLTLLKGKAPTQRPGTLRTAAELSIARAAPPGKSTLEVTVRDLLSGGRGSGRAELTLLGGAADPEEHLRIAELRWGAGGEAPAGAVLPATLVLKGIATRKLAARGHQLDLAVHSRVLDAAGRTVAEQKEALFRGELGFAPDAFPLEHQLSVPAGSPAGEYQATIEVHDRIADHRAGGRLPLRVVPVRLGIWNVHLRDVSGFSRQRFLLGEQTFVRFAVFGLTRRGEHLDVSVDLAVAGPDGGVYLAQPGALVSSGAASRPFARAGRLPGQLPLTLPALAPTGRYRVVVRARDRLARKDVVAEQSFTLEGSAPQPLAELTVTGLEVRERAELPPGKGDTFVLGRTYQLELVVGGLKPKEVRKLTWAVAVEGNLRLRTPAGSTVHEAKRLFSERRELRYRPLRLVLPATWKVPADLTPGLYDLEVDALDQLGDRASQLRRRVELRR